MSDLKKQPLCCFKNLFSSNFCVHSVEPEMRDSEECSSLSFPYDCMEWELKCLKSHNNMIKMVHAHLDCKSSQDYTITLCDEQTEI